MDGRFDENNVDSGPDQGHRDEGYWIIEGGGRRAILAEFSDIIVVDIGGILRRRNQADGGWLGVVGATEFQAKQRQGSYDYPKAVEYALAEHDRWASCPNRIWRTS